MYDPYLKYDNKEKKSTIPSDLGEGRVAVVVHVDSPPHLLSLFLCYETKLIVTIADIKMSQDLDNFLTFIRLAVRQALVHPFPIHGHL